MATAVCASRVFETHVRKGNLTSAGAKHSSAAPAMLDLLDDAVEQPNGKGATHVRILAGLPTPLKVRHCASSKHRRPR